MEMCFRVLNVNIVTDVMKTTSLLYINAFECSPTILAYQEIKNAIETICTIQSVLFVCRFSQ